MAAKRPPSPPPMPPVTAVPRQATTKHSARVSPLIQKLQATPQGSLFRSKTPLPPPDDLAPQCGPYFFYGFLMDPKLLSEILSLSETPHLRPAKVVGYSLKMWGQYPALVDGESGEVVEGMLYQVAELKHAERLAEYETSAYRPAPCLIYAMEEAGEQEFKGTTFKYLGSPADISGGTFRLDSWLRSIGRATGNVANTEPGSRQSD